MNRTKLALQLFASCLVYSAVVMVIDFVIIFLVQRELSSVAYVLSFVLIAEGGLSLVVGGAAASFSTTFGKMAEVVFHAKPWDAKQLRAAEKSARVWIVAGVILLLFGLLVSAL